ncbi:MAG TPA: imidazole glycerol phosphate synthase subunit HisH [Firmicutes bacterium]|jgi:glutamine amidotransferase|nr:imidazole glycerol phosphate synthase subunit HisH [Bacillota bacterium]
MITIVDYGAGNLNSVQKALQYLGLPNQVSADVAEVASARALILPGVGAFGAAARSLAGLRKVVRSAVASGRPFLGICLGLQLLLASSQEDDQAAGLGIIPGQVIRFAPGLKVPHMGWNTVTYGQESRLFAGIPSGTYFYFVHSYYALPAAETIGRTQYGVEFASAISFGNCHAVQFHPEKSGRAGLQLLRNFGEMAGC